MDTLSTQAPFVDKILDHHSPPPAKRGLMGTRSMYFRNNKRLRSTSAKRKSEHCTGRAARRVVLDIPSILPRHRPARQAVNFRTLTVDQREAKKRSGRAETLRNQKGDLLRDASDLVGTASQRAKQRTLRFIRWLMAWLYREAPWSAAMATPRRSLGGITARTFYTDDFSVKGQALFRRSSTF
jgi:hypothetical protein